MSEEVNTPIVEEEIKEVTKESEENAKDEVKMEVDVKAEEKKDSTPVKKPSTLYSGSINPNLNYRVKVSGLPRFYSSTVSYICSLIISICNLYILTNTSIF